MKHRHLDISPDTKVEDLPLAALHDLLDRGDLEDWAPLLRCLERDPFGRTARAVERLVDVYPMYGTSRLIRDWIERCRQRHGGRVSGKPARSLREIRRDLGLTQREVAARMGISQSDYSKLERRRDLRVSTFRSAVKALGGRLELGFEGDGEWRIVLPGERAGVQGRE